MKKFVITYEKISTHDVEVELDDEYFDRLTRGDRFHYNADGIEEEDIPECDGTSSTYEQECLPIHAYDMEGNQVWTR